MGYYRFLHNEQVTLGELRQSLLSHCQCQIRGRQVLAISDSSEINLRAHRGRVQAAELGVLSNDRDVGFFIHPTLMLDASDGFPFGISDVHLWSRPIGHADKHTRNYKQQAIEEKESFKWLHASEYSQRCLAAASQVTYIGDREGDIYEVWARVPNTTTQALFRARRNRKIAESQQTLYAYLSEQPCAGTYAFQVTADTRKSREAREAWMAVRFVAVTIQRPARLRHSNYPPSLQLSAVEAREIQPPSGQKPIHWRLLTTHPIRSLETALQAIRWYSWRWQIEQLFAILKQHGLDLESTQLESVAAIKRLCLVSLGAAVRILQLQRGRDDACRPAALVFDSNQQQCLAQLSPRLNGRTRQQQNPFPPYTLAWATWLIARLGRWSGYTSQRPPGIALLSRGLKHFDSLFEGWLMAQG
ncbi:MAG: IS4 family transposase [Leptolyngbya sp. SIOISBB]|nr:IS4 family transposase [Leptolyngbya sp. SIOISBB]